MKRGALWKFRKRKMYSLRYGNYSMSLTLLTRRYIEHTIMGLMNKLLSTIIYLVTHDREWISIVSRFSLYCIIICKVRETLRWYHQRAPKIALQRVKARWKWTFGVHLVRPIVLAVFTYTHRPIYDDLRLFKTNLSMSNLIGVQRVY